MTASDKHVEAVIAKHRDRAAKGLSKYGTTLERTDLTDRQWLVHLQEELMDAAAYAERCISNIDTTQSASAALAFMLRAATEHCRIVCSGDLTTHQIAESQASGRFFVEPGGGLGWALVPWDLTTQKDRQREADYHAKVGQP